MNQKKFTPYALTALPAVQDRDKNGLYFIQTPNGMNIYLISELDSSAIPLDLTDIGVSQFIELTDTPNDYTGCSDFLVRVNKGEDGLVFVEDTSKVKSMQIALTPRGQDLVEGTMVFEFTVLKKMQITSYPVLGVVEAPTGESILLSIAKNDTFIGVMNPFLTIEAGNKYSTNQHDVKDTIFDVGDKMSFFLNKVGAIVPGSGMDIYFEYVEL